MYIYIKVKTSEVEILISSIFQYSFQRINQFSFVKQISLFVENINKVLFEYMLQWRGWEEDELQQQEKMVHPRY